METLPLTHAAKKVGVDWRTLRRASEADLIPSAKRVETARGEKWLFSPKAIEEAIEWAIERTKMSQHSAPCWCQRCGTFLGIRPRSRIDAGREKYCTPCWPSVRKTLPQCQPEHLRTLNPNGAREHHRHVREAVARKEAEGLYDAAEAAAYIAATGGKHMTRNWLISRYRQHGELHDFYGSNRLLFRREALDEIARTRPLVHWREIKREWWRWFKSERPRAFATWYYNRHKSVSMYGRLASAITAQEEGKRAGRPKGRQVADEEKHLILELHDKGLKPKTIAYKVGIHYRTILRVIDDSLRT
jgi:hypothetical protein